MITTKAREGIHVLLVEDDPDDHALIHDLLSEIDTARYRLRWESGYEAALAAIEKELPDVILADYRLGSHTGLDLLQAVRALVHAPPVILLTGVGDRETDLRAMEAGAADYLVKGSLDENLLERSIRYSVRQHQLVAEIQALVLRDELTGLHNRRGFVTIADQQLSAARRSSVPCVLFYADLDNMKEINDVQGHGEGDRALTDVAEGLRRTFRASDILARIGGDEFAMLAVEADESSVEVVLRRLQANLTTLERARDRAYPLSLSAGWAAYDPANPVPLESLLAAADGGMYETKRRRKAAGAQERGRERP